VPSAALHPSDSRRIAAADAADARSAVWHLGPRAAGTRAIAQFDSLFPAEQLKAAQDYFAANVRWRYGWPQGEKDPYSHWVVDFLGAGPENETPLDDKLIADPNLKPIADLWRTLRSGPMRGHHLIRCYANAHTYGVEGYPHFDSKTPNNCTAIVYLNPAWKAEWAGELVLLDEAKDVVQAVLPKPGRVVLIPGDVLHVARGVSRHCPAIRVSLAFKSLIPSPA